MEGFTYFVQSKIVWQRPIDFLLDVSLCFYTVPMMSIVIITRIVDGVYTFVQHISHFIVCVTENLLKQLYHVSICVGSMSDRLLKGMKRIYTAHSHTKHRALWILHLLSFAILRLPVSLSTHQWKVRDDRNSTAMRMWQDVWGIDMARTREKRWLNHRIA